MRHNLHIAKSTIASGLGVQVLHFFIIMSIVILNKKYLPGNLNTPIAYCQTFLVVF
jgi:hypothetical protein